MKTVKIKNKDYVMVNERIKKFRELYPDWSLETEIIHLDNESATIRAVIKNDAERIIATGLAHELRDDKLSMVNKTSHVENCETSAWGRALGNLGIGIDDSIASAEEVLNAMAKQNNPLPEDTTAEDLGWDKEAAQKNYKEFCELLEIVSLEGFKKFAQDASEASKNNRWATSWNETFKKNLEKKLKELKGE